MLGSVRFGSGLMVARLPDSTWSAPSAVALGGVGMGGQFGLELTDFVFMLNNDAAVATFCKSGVLTLDGNISITLGPGRSAEYGALVGTSGVACLYAYSKTRGVYGGATLEVSILSERSHANKKMYGRKLKATQLLGGEVPPPPEAEPLMRLLNSEALRMPPPSDGQGKPELALPNQHEAQSREVSELAAEEWPVVEVEGVSAVGADENRLPQEVEASSEVTELAAEGEPVVEAEGVSAVEADLSHSPQEVEAPLEVAELPAEGPQDESQTNERPLQQGQSSR